jgi:hypothetical protein
MAIKFKGDPAAAAAENNFPVAPAGEYYMKCIDAEEQESKKTGKPMIKGEYVITEGEFADRVHVWNYITFMQPGDKGYGMAVHALKAHGLPYEGDIEVSAQDFIGVAVKVQLEQDEYPAGSGKLKNVIKKFLLPPDMADTEPAREVTPAAKAVFTKPAPVAAAPARKAPPWGKR